MDWIPGLTGLESPQLISFPGPFFLFFPLLSFHLVIFIFLWSDEEWCRREGDDFIWLTAASFVVNLIKFYLN